MLPRRHEALPGLRQDFAGSLTVMGEGSRFTSAQWLEGLLPEVNSARRVLDSADRLIRRDGPLDRDIDAVLAIYSIGVERFMKLALATAAMSRGEQWPSVWSTRESLGHALDETDERLQGELRKSLAVGGWERQSLLESGSGTPDNDPVWAAVVRALRNYADRRFHHLDLVAGPVGSTRSSRDMWDDVEHAAFGSDQSIAHHHRRTQVGSGLGPSNTSFV